MQPSRAGQGPRRMAAIDIGSNSIHMVTVEVGAERSLRVIGRAKAMVRLGAGIPSGGELHAGGMARAVATLDHQRRLAEAHGAREILAVATAAVRDAANGPELLARLARETGIRPRAISGREEARLIYLAVRHSVHAAGGRTLVVDIGGGSVEMALGSGAEPDWAVSEPLGVLRLAPRLGGEDPPAAEDRRRLAEHVAATLAPHADRARREGFGVVVCTSGTARTLGALALALETGRPATVLDHVAVSARSLRKVSRRLLRSSFEERLRWRGLHPRRADLVVAGSLMLEVLLEQLGAREVLLCDWALREGILLDRLEPGRRPRRPAPLDVRRNSVLGLAERFAHDGQHARHVARLALALFDSTRSLPREEGKERSLLEYAALLHDVGSHLSRRARHKHSAYLIRHGGLRGFRPDEIEIMAGIARYHRRAAPRKRHRSFARLPPLDQRAVRTLAGILRVADALDAGNRQCVSSASLAVRGGFLVVEVGVEGDCERELQAAARRCGLLERALGRPVRFELVPARQRQGCAAETSEQGV